MAWAYLGCHLRLPSITATAPHSPSTDAMSGAETVLPAVGPRPVARARTETQTVSEGACERRGWAVEHSLFVVVVPSSLGRNLPVEAVSDQVCTLRIS